MVAQELDKSGAGYALRQESVKRALHKRVMPSYPVRSRLSIKATDMTSTRSVGLREQESKKDYPLKFLSLLIKWDNVQVALHPQVSGVYVGVDSTKENLQNGRAQCLRNRK
jgi:hypothetical protein